MSTKFHHLVNLPALPEAIIREGLNSKFEYVEFPVTYSASSRLFKNSNFYKLLLDQFGLPHVAFLKNSPMSWYNWHMDKGRSCAINWVIKSNPKAMTLFRDTHDWQAIHEIEEVDYVLHCPTILDTTHRHCVINNGLEYRIILTVGVNEIHSYKEVNEFLQSLIIKEY